MTGTHQPALILECTGISQHSYMHVASDEWFSCRCIHLHARRDSCACICWLQIACGSKRGASRDCSFAVLGGGSLLSDAYMQAFHVSDDIYNSKVHHAVK